MGAGGGAALVLFSPKVKLLLPGCSAGCEDAPKLKEGVDAVPPKLDVTFAAGAGWPPKLDETFAAGAGGPPPKLKFIPPADGAFWPNMGADVLGVLCWFPKLKLGVLLGAAAEEA